MIGYICPEISNDTHDVLRPTVSNLYVSGTECCKTIRNKLSYILKNKQSTVLKDGRQEL